MLFRSFVLVFAIGYALTVTHAKARDMKPFETVLVQLEMARIIMHLENFNSVGDPIVDLLDQDDAKTYEIELDGDKEHSILVVCDDDCDDVDVALYDRNWKLMEEDDEHSDSAFLEGKTPYSGIYYLKINLPDCDVDPCAVAAMAFKK